MTIPSDMTFELRASSFEFIYIYISVSIYLAGFCSHISMLSIGLASTERWASYSRSSFNKVRAPGKGRGRSEEGGSRRDTLDVCVGVT